MKVKDKFSRLAKKYAGRILIHYYGESKCLAFSPLQTPQESTMKCKCGHSEWNATNFGNTIHFCPDREIEVEVTDFTANPV